MTDAVYQLTDESNPARFSKTIDASIRMIELKHGMSPSNKHIKSELTKLEAVRVLFICDFPKGDECRQWRQYLNLDEITYNEALCLLLGVVPEAAGLIFDDLSTVTKKSEIPNNFTSLAFYEESANNYLKRRFGSNNIPTHEFILWAMDKGLIREARGRKVKTKQKTITKKRQMIINELAREVLTNYPTSTRESAAEDISLLLKSRHDIELKPSTIVRNYLHNWRRL